MRSALKIDQIEEFLTQSSSFADWEPPPLRTRCYANHWDNLSALVKERGAEESDTESTRSSDSMNESMWLMENLPCDADLTTPLNIHYCIS
jgi:hypothetical protein